MTEITAYKACDGKLFYDEQECFEYESTLESNRTIAYLLNNCVDFLNGYYEVLPIDDKGYFLSETFYIRFKNASSDERLKIIKFLDFHFGVVLDGQSDNFYYFDGEKPQFQSLSRKIEILKNELDTYEEIKNNLITQLESMEEK